MYNYHSGKLWCFCMSLKRFREENKKKSQIIVFTIVCILLIVGVVLYQSYALFETKDNFNVVSGGVENPGDLSFAFYVNDEIVLEAPSKESNLALSEKSNCNNGVTLSWNVDSWNASVDYSNYEKENTSKTKCNLIFRDAVYSDYITSCGENGNTAVDCMKKYSDKDSTNLAYDETEDNNLRYIGSNPNNYVSFNNELWRIIGVMENIDDGTGNKESRIKLIREEPIGKYSWDSSPSNINGGYGVNEWSVSDLKFLLNDLYYNQKSGQCYIGESDATAACDFTNVGIQDEYKKYIAISVWNTGSNGSNAWDQLKVQDFYKLERGNHTGKLCLTGSAYDCNDTVTRTTTWTGLVGLITPSDYGFATSNLYPNCYNNFLAEWWKEELSFCVSNNWLYKPFYHWTIMPRNTGSAYGTYAITATGAINNNDAASDVDYVFPSIYLKSSVKIISGKGTKELPYQLFV